MGTQHPDNARAPFWEQDGDGYVSTSEEVLESAMSFIELGCEEYMWDWEGKHVDEGVVEKLLTEYHDFFSKHQLGKDRFLTFRIPNIWEEKGRSLARAFMNMLTAEEFAVDLGLNARPLFEIILPMADKAEKLIQMQRRFTELARFKHKLFDDEKTDFDYLEIIPLIEGVREMTGVRTLLDNYLVLHKKQYKRKPEYMRVFLARSDPALMSGLVPAVIANRVALSELYEWSKDNATPIFPWLGAGSLPFRGGLRPDRISTFAKTYPGIRSVSIQSSFRYDYPVETVKAGISELNVALSSTEPVLLSHSERAASKRIIKACEAPYQQTISSIASTINAIAEHVPSRRDRRLHIGLLGYGRTLGKRTLPRAIAFTASLYSLGIPPELIGTGRGIAALSPKDLQVLEKQYITLADDLMEAGQYLNTENLAFLAKKSRGFKQIQKDVQLLESYCGKKLEPKTSTSFIHRNWTSTLYFQLQAKESLTASINESAKIRNSLG